MKSLLKIILIFLVYYTIGLVIYYFMTISAYPKACGGGELNGLCPSLDEIINKYLFRNPTFYFEMLFWPLKVLGGPPIR